MSLIKIVMSLVFYQSCLDWRISWCKILSSWQNLSILVNKYFSAHFRYYYKKEHQNKKKWLDKFGEKSRDGQSLGFQEDKWVREQTLKLNYSRLYKNLEQKLNTMRDIRLWIEGCNLRLTWRTE